MESPNRLSRPLSVLVVDDNADYATSCADVLACYGFAATAATSGAEALAVAARDRPDVVLLDLVMPVLNG